MRIAIVSYFAPPQPAVASHRVLRLTRALIGAGHDVHWVTLDPKRLPDRDETLANLIPPAVHVHGLGGPNLVDRTARNFPEKVLRSLIFGLPDWFAVPDRHVEWTLRLRRHLPRIVSRERLDAVLLCCGPHGQILALPSIRRRARNLKIFVDYRDLLSGNPWREAESPRIRRRLLQRERRVLAHADVVFANTADAKRRFLDTVGEIAGLEVEVMRNTADYDLAREVARPGSVELGPGLHLGFFGTIFERRRLLPLLQALDCLSDDQLAAVTVHCYCDPVESARFLSEDLATIGERVGSRVIRRDYLSYGPALRTMQAMDVLVLINSPDERDVIFVPGKLYDYLMAQRPIVFFGCEGDAWRIVAATCGSEWCFQYEQPAEAAERLAGLIGRRPPEVSPSADHEPPVSFAPLLERLERAARGTATPAP